MPRLPVFFLLAPLVALTALGCGKQPEPAPPPSEPDPKVAESEQANKAEAVRRLKRIGAPLATGGPMQRLPLGTQTGTDRLGLSWRVALLPLIGEGELYNQFKLREPWDSEHNKKLIAKMPEVYASPGKDAGAGMTFIRSFCGPGAILPSLPDQNKGPLIAWNRHTHNDGRIERSLDGISDGTCHTLFAAEAREAIEWTNPNDLTFDPGLGAKQKPLPKLGGVFPGGFHAITCCGEVHFFPGTLSQRSLRALITTSAGDVRGRDANDVLQPPGPEETSVPKSVPDALPDAAGRKAAVENLQAIMNGVLDYYDAASSLPSGIAGPKREPRLSWRVQVLPFVGEEKLHKEFKLDEPWDSEHNKKLVDKMPPVFASPGKPAEKGHTFLRTTYGPGGVFRRDDRGWIRSVSQWSDFVAGPSHTILIVEAAGAVPWTKPDEVVVPVKLKGEFDKEPAKEWQRPGLGGVFADGFHAALADGTVTFYKADYPSAQLARLLCPDGGVFSPLRPRDKVGYSIALTDTLKK